MKMRQGTVHIQTDNCFGAVNVKMAV